MYKVVRLHKPLKVDAILTLQQDEVQLNSTGFCSQLQLVLQIIEAVTTPDYFYEGKYYQRSVSCQCHKPHLKVQLDLSYSPQ